MIAEYFYRIERGQATLQRGDDKPSKRIGQFATDAKAREACERHYMLACRMAVAAERPLPTKHYL